MASASAFVSTRNDFGHISCLGYEHLEFSALHHKRGILGVLLKGNDNDDILGGLHKGHLHYY